jgi:hypothetical protein
MLLLLLVACPLGKEPSDSEPVGDLACGALTCGGEEVCVETFLPASCQNLTDTGDACPEGTTRTLCGGAGFPCCCEPAPDPTWACQTCAGTPSCDCVTCEGSQACTASGAGERQFNCENLPKP